jgi:diguanylate cyclase (GGDEF)-like protein/PAS domain S-box-containing protein
MKMRVAFLLALVALLSAAVYLMGGFAPLDRGLSSLRFQASERAPTGAVVVVEIDARSLEAIGTWPWSRQIHADIIDRLDELGAADIAIDIDFSTVSNEPADAALEAALRRAGDVILAVFQQPPSAAGGTPIYNQPIERFARYAWPGTVNIRPDGDGATRRLAFGEWIAGTPVLSIPALLSGRAGTIGTDFGVDFSIAAGSIDRISAIDILEGRVDAARIAGRSVIVAASAVELRDIFEVPVYGFVSGGMLQALATETLILDRAMTTGGPAVAIIGLVLIAAVAVAVVFLMRWVATLVLFAGIAVILEAAAFLAQIHGQSILETGAWHLALAGFAAVVLSREVDLRGLAAAAFRRQAFDARKVLHRVVEDSPAGIVVADRDGKILAASDAVAEILGLSEGVDLVGGDAADILPAELAKALREVVAAHPRPVDMGEIAVETRDGLRTLEVTATASTLSGDAGTRGDDRPVVGCITFDDVTEKRMLEARTSQLAWYDSLTGLPNRNFFADALASALRELPVTGRPAALMFFDVDRFKQVNDTLGHHFGDLLITAIGKRAEEALDRSGLLVRLSGDEFAILAPRLDRGESAYLANKIIRALSSPFMLEGYRVAVGASAGITMLEEGMDATAAMRRADVALNVAKAEGNTLRFFEPDMDDDLQSRRDIEVALWDALQNGQLDVEYQQQVDLTTRRPVGFEALLRWSHPLLGQVQPERFVPIAEATGLIDPIGASILSRACQAVAPLGDMKLAVNVSPVQFVRGDLTVAVGNALSASNLDPSRLELELTESVFLRRVDLVQRTMNKLRDIGVTFALDDFGTGYSSLNYVREFPFDKIKIDRRFTTAIPSDPGAVSIVRAVLAMAEGLGKRVIAEGIETEEQVRMLRLLGCQQGQGFLFGKAIPADGLRALIGESLDAEGRQLSA